MTNSQADLDGFRKWLTSRGRSEGTADVYCSHLSACFDAKNLKSRLLGGLSPNTKRGVLAALRAWAKYTRDGDLVAELDDVKLPSPERVREKVPLDRDSWDALCDAIEEADLEDNLRAACRMIAVRGFRVGDVCRLSKPEVRQGLETETLIYKAKSGRHLRWGVGLYRGSLEQFIASRNWNRVRDLITPTARDDNRQRAARCKISRTINRIATRVGLEPGSVTPHRLRRTYAVYFLEAVNGDIVKLKDHMGWADLATAMRYVDHSQQVELDKIAEQMRRGTR